MLFQVCLIFYCRFVLRFSVLKLPFMETSKCAFELKAYGKGNERGNGPLKAPRKVTVHVV